MAKKSPRINSPTTASGPRNFVQIADDYARSVVADKKGAFTGKLIRSAAKRYLADRKRAATKACAFVFDEWHAADPCSFIEKLPYVEGTWDTEEMVLHPSQIWFLVQLFGFRSRKNGARRFTSALLAVARKNGKSSLAAAILLYCLCCEDEPGAQIVTAATTYDQASIILKIAQKIAHRSPEMVDAFGLEVMAKVITRLDIGASFKAVHAKASTQDGLNPSHTGLDEIHAHKTADLLNVLQSAAGARRSPLWLFTTTEGYENPGPWADIRRYAKQLLTGVLDLTDHDHFLVAFYAVDDEDKEFDPACWPKANPLWDVSEPLRDAIAKEAAEAKQMPGKLGEFKIKRLNRPAAAAHAWVDVMRWKACNGPVDLEKLRGQPCWGGLDLASTSDLTSFRLTWLVDGEYFTHAWRWVPADAVAQRTERGTTPYAAWVASGHLKQTDGNVTDYEVVRKDILGALEEFRPAKVGFDTWNAQTLVNQLVEADVPGVEFVQFVQGTRSYHPAVQAAEAAYMGGKLAHGGDPVLAWCAANVVMKQDDNLNNAPSKKRSAEKIDDFCAFLMSLGVGLEAGEAPKEYRMLIV